MKNLIKVILKYKLYLPCSLLRLLYFNLYRFNRRDHKSLFLPTRKAVLDISSSAFVEVCQPVIFGWCNMKFSNMETGLVMGDNSKLEFYGGGNFMLIGYGSYIQVGPNAILKIGNSFINREVKIICNKQITIGSGCVIAMGTVIRDNDGGNHQILVDDYINQKPVVISDNVWLGENSMVLKGVTIGEGSVVAAYSLVTKDVPPHCIVAGSPAKVIKENINWKA